MFTARNLLNEPNLEKRHRDLRQQLSAGPQRLRREFITIFEDLRENHLLRATSAMFLYAYRKELNPDDSNEIADAFIRVAGREFPAQTLQIIGAQARGGTLHPDIDVLVQVFVGFAAVVPACGRKFLFDVHEALRGSFLEAQTVQALERHRLNTSPQDE